MIYCSKLKKQAEPLKKPPFPGALGEKIFQEISQEGWNLWISHQTMLINEYRLSLIDPKSRDFLKEEMDKFFFGQGSDKPTGFSPEE